MIGVLKKWFREPLLHFLLIGGALFLVSSWRAGSAGGNSGRIVVTRARIEELKTGFVRTWQRPPTQQELAGLIEEDVKDEISVREALAKGLDRDDPIIRRRLRRKLELANQEGVEAASPTDEDLRAFLKAHPESVGLQNGAQGWLPELSEVRDAVERGWRAAQRKERGEALFRKLLARYKVVVEAPAEAKAAPAAKKAL